MSRLSSRLYRTVRFRWPIYDLSYWALNRAARKAYADEKARMVPDAIQRRVLTEVTERGICVTRFNEVFPDANFSEIQALAEQHLQKPRNRELLKSIQDGAWSRLGTKFFLVRVLGNPPVFDHDDLFVALSLGDRALRLACGYLGMFSRVMDMDVWCNVATPGPDQASQTWHRDADDRKSLKMFLYLRDVDRSAGPFCYIPGSQNGGPFGKTFPQTMPHSHYPPQEEVEKRFAEDQVLACTGQAGTLIFCDPSGLHRGGNPKEGIRLLFTTTFTTNAGLLDNNAGRYSIAGLRKETLTPAAQYGIGHLKPVPTSAAAMV
jgi:hypothetical protein